MPFERRGPIISYGDQLQLADWLEDWLCSAIRGECIQPSWLTICAGSFAHAYLAGIDIGSPCKGAPKRVALQDTIELPPEDLEAAELSAF